MSKIEVDTIEPQSGTSLTLGASGDTITIPSGATLTNSGTATGFGGGKVLQVVNATDSTGRDTNSTSYVTASNTLSVTITPSSASNKIFLIATSGLFMDTAGQTAFATIFRGGTNLVSGTTELSNTTQGASVIGSTMSMSFLDSPSSTSALTYDVRIRASGGTVFLNSVSSNGSLTAFEIEG